MAWSTSGSHAFYTTVDDAWRPFKLWRHELGSAVEADVCVLHEPDDRYWLNLELSRDEKWIVVSAGSKITSEVSLLADRRPDRCAPGGRATGRSASSTASSRPVIACWCCTISTPRTSSWRPRR